MDTAKPGDVVPDEDEDEEDKGDAPTDTRPPDLPPHLDTAQPGDIVPDDEGEEGDGTTDGPTGAAPPDLPPGVDTAQPGDILPNDNEDDDGITDIPAQTRPPGLPPHIDTAQPGDIVPDDEDDENGDGITDGHSQTRPAGLPPHIDTAQPGDIVPDEDEGAEGDGITDGPGTRPADLPPGVDAGQPGDIVPDDEEDDGSTDGHSQTRPADLPPHIDTAQPGDIVPDDEDDEDGDGITDGLSQTRPADLPPHIDTGQPGDIVPDEDEDAAGDGITDIPTQTRPADLPPHIDTGQPGDIVPDEDEDENGDGITDGITDGPSGAAPKDLPPGVDTGQPGDIVPDDEEVAGDASTAPAPTGLRVASDTRTTVSLRWSAVTGADAYRVDYRKSGTTTWRHSGFVYTGTSHTVTGLTCRTTYFFRVRARGNGTSYSRTYSSPSASASETTDLCVVDAPTGVTIVSDTETTVSLRWSAVTGAAAYRVDYRKSGTTNWRLSGFVYSATSHTVTDLTCKTTYFFRVRARGNGTSYSRSYSAPSASASETTDLCIVDKPENLTVTGTAESTARLHWDAVTGADAYKVEFRQSDTVIWRQSGYVYTGTSHTATGLICNTSYHFQVRARGDGTSYSMKYGPYSTAVSETTDLCIVDKPENLRVTSVAETEVSLRWDAVTNAVAYRVDYRKSGTTNWRLGAFVRSGTSHRQTGLDRNSTYHFRVRARGDGTSYSLKYSDPSSSVTGRTVSHAPQVRNLRTTGADETSVSLSWDAVADAVAYKVEYRSSSSRNWHHSQYMYTGTTATVSGLTCNTDYEFRVKARGDGDPYSTTYGTASETASKATALCIVAAPSGLTVVSDTETTVSIRWSAVTGAAAYRVEYRSSDTPIWRHRDFVYSGTSHTATGLICNTTYYFRVSARGDGTSYSMKYGASATPVLETTDLCIVDEPENLRVISAAETAVSLRWDAVTDAAAYRVEYRKSSSTDWRLGAFVSSGTTHRQTGLDRDSTYHFRVRARGDGASHSLKYSDPSDSVSGRTVSHAPQVRNLTATAADETSVSLSWDTVADAVAYKVEYRSSGTNNWRQSQYMYTGTTATVSGLTCNTDYEFRVKARGDGDPYSTTYGTASETASKTTALCMVAAPTDLRAASPTAASVGLSWSAVTGADTYKVEYRQSGTTVWRHSEYVHTGTSHTATGLVCNTAYYFRVSARGDGTSYSVKYSGPSASASASTAACVLNAPPPAGLTAAASTRNSIMLSWDSVPDASSYRLERREEGSGAWSAVGAVSTATSRSATGLKCATTYHFRVSARGDGSPYTTRWGSPSAEVSATTLACLDVGLPTLGGTVSPRTMHLSWPAVPEASKYQVRYRESTGRWNSPPLETSSTALTVRRLTRDTTFVFEARAYGDGSTRAAAWGEWSASLTTTTGLVPSSRAAPTVQNITAGSVTLSWARVEGAGSYQVRYRKLGRRGWAESVEQSIPATGNLTHIMTGLESETDYLFQIRLRGDGTRYMRNVNRFPAWSPWSDSARAMTTVSTAPAAPAPARLRATGSTVGSVTLNWDSVSGADGYKLERSLDGSIGWTIAGTAADRIAGTSYTVTGLDCETTFYFRISARGDDSTYSTAFGNPSTASVSGTTAACYAHPTGLGIRIEVNDDNDIDVTYTPSGPSHFYRFELHRSRTRHGTYAVAVAANDFASPADFDNQAKGYWYKARGRNCATASRTNCGSWSPFTAAIFLNTAPAFDAASYSFSVDETAVPSAVVGSVTATDPDAGHAVAYSITGGNAAGKFTIAATTGQITVTGDLDYASTASYTLTVQADDSNGGTDTATVIISVLKVNEISISTAGDVTEGSDMTFTVTADRGGVTVAYTITGTATSGSDYTPPGTAPLTVTVPAGQTTQTITVRTTSDTTNEVFESVIITLDSVVGGTGAIDSTNNSATARIADLISVSSIDDDESASPIVIDTSEATSTIGFKLDADGGFIDFNHYNHRAYVLNLEVHPTGAADDKWSRGAITSAHTKDSGAKTYTKNLPSYADLGRGQIVWVEGGNPPGDRYVVLDVNNATVSHDKYRISIAKPDFAVIDRPTISSNGPSPRSEGHLTLTFSIRNSADRDSGGRDDDTSVLTFCDATGTRSRRERILFEDLRASGSSSLIQSESNSEVRLSIICRGTNFINGTTVGGYAAVSTDEWKQAVVESNNTIRWPFNVDTLWKRQTTIVGGLQTLIDAPCTLSFPLRIRALTQRMARPPNTGTKAVTTTGHCADETNIWKQGALGGTSNADLGTTLGALQPTDVTCKILDQSNTLQTRSDCRRGDQSYATGSRLAFNAAIFKPAAQNSDNKDHGLSIQHFKHSGTEFNIVGARPPHELDTVHKVGRTTGWTSGAIEDYMNNQDSTCPGNALGHDDNFNNHDLPSKQYYIECRIRASFQVLSGDSGSPVFVTQTANDSLLVGVIWGNRGDNGLFIPIERIYAESLLKGYDWLPELLRPLPALDHSRRHTESLGLDDDGLAIEAEFETGDFSQSSEGMTYEALLHRNGVPVTTVDGSMYTQEVSRDAEGGAPGNIARFDVSSIPSTQRNGEFTVKVRLCPYAIGSQPNTSYCSEYGSNGTRRLKPPPAPQNYRPTEADATLVRLSWNTVAGATRYKFRYRIQGASAWVDISGTTQGFPTIIRGLSCNIAYEFAVRALGDGTTHDATLGFWSDTATVTTRACSTSGASGQLDAPHTDDSEEDSQ